MYLKKLALNGFKSFADPTEIVLEAGITAVVGPNGCGKTNIADAVRWVLGEQSAKGLRAGEMSQVIFNGTEGRKGASMAEVTLVLSNEDGMLPLEYNEISVTRRVYRDNEGEYLINGSPARLKDVKDLFLGTGLGVNAYSIMEQGKMDQILNAKPTERRILFEEAAGITRYKVRKQEAVRKLEATEQNLIRISDIAAELKRQITSLERQAKQAEKYRAYKERLNRLQVQLLLVRRAELSAQIEELREKAETHRLKLENIQKGLREKEAAEKKNHETLQNAEEAWSRVREEILQVEGEIKVLKERREGMLRHRDLLRQRRAGNEKEVEMSLSRMKELEEWMQKAQAFLEGQKEREAILVRRRKELEQQATALEARVREAQDLLERHQASWVEAAAVLTQQRAEKENLLERENERISQIEQLERVLTERRQESLQKRQTLQEKMERLEAAKREEETLRGRIARLQEERSALRLQWDELQQKAQELQEASAQLRSRWKVLQELHNKWTGYDAAVKAVLQAKKEEPLLWRGVYGTTADCIQVDPAYETAVESFLAPYLQAVVVENEMEARRVLQWLRERKAGWVTLLLMDRLRSGFSENSGETFSQNTWIRTTPEFQPLAAFLFRRVHAVKSWEEALRSSDEQPQDVFLSSDGSRAGPAGVLRAGEGETGVSLLGRHREIAELEARIQEIRKNEEMLEEEREKLRLALRAGEEEEEKLRKEERRLQEKNAGDIQDLSRLQAEEKHLHSGLQEVQAAKERLENSGKEIRKHLEEHEQKIAEQEKKHLHLQEEIEHLKREVEQLQVQREALGREVLEVSMHCSGLEREVERTREERERYRKELENLQETITRRKNENQNMIEEDGQFELELERLVEQENQSEKRKSLLQEELIRRENVRREAQAAVEQSAREVKEIQEQQGAAQEELHRWEMAEAQIQVELRNIEEKLQVEYRVDLHEPPSWEGPFEVEKAKEECEELRRKIEKLGLVNMVAVEEYDELSQRYQFLEEQRQDLIKAKADLQQAIAKINRTSREMFLGTFTVVQEHFKDVFQRLFEGGRAELLLIEEGDVLEAGVEIVARPPGKRLQSVSLLSGGEKALTAIALLFALFMVKPSPFCLMDEIDAPLDDVNVERFTRMLKEFSRRTQFLVITHNKVTMESADVLYGVTMQESGVSRVLSARFKEKEARREAPVP